jgi:hypothetical protein
MVSPSPAVNQELRLETMVLIALAEADAISHANQLSAMLNAFAALGSVVGVFTAFAAFLSVIYEDDAEQAASAATTAAGLGFIPGAVAAVAVYLMSLSTYHALA